MSMGRSPWKLTGYTTERVTFLIILEVLWTTWNSDYFVPFWQYHYGLTSETGMTAMAKTNTNLHSVQDLCANHSECMVDHLELILSWKSMLSSTEGRRRNTRNIIIIRSYKNQKLKGDIFYLKATKEWHPFSQSFSCWFQ